MRVTRVAPGRQELVEFFRTQGHLPGREAQRQLELAAAAFRGEAHGEILALAKVAAFVATLSRQGL